MAAAVGAVRPGGRVAPAAVHGGGQQRQARGAPGTRGIE
jgi:hypothetical protein